MFEQLGIPEWFAEVPIVGDEAPVSPFFNFGDYAVAPLGSDQFLVLDSDVMPND